MKKSTKVLLTAALALGLGCNSALAYSLTNLQVERLSNPQAVDREHPRRDVRGQLNMFF